MNAAAVDGLSWIQALGWTLLHFLWQGVLVGGAFAALRSLIPKQCGTARYVNGLVALALLAILPLATLLIVHARQGVEVADFVVAASVLPDDIQPPDEIQPLEDAPVLASGTIEGAFESALPLIVCAWLAGVLLVMGRSWYQWRQLLQIAQRWSTRHADLEQMLFGLADRFGFVRRIRVLVSDRIETPTLIGWIRPVILLPAAVALGFPRQQIELILAHELGHLRRYDHLANLAQVLLETLFFYHPVVHWIGREVRHEREVCCDTLVLRVTRGEPRLYAHTLAALEELRQPPTQLVLAASGGVLLERVRRILGVPSVTASSARSVWLPVAMAALTLVLAMALHVDRTELVTHGPNAVARDWQLSADIQAADLSIAPRRLVASLPPAAIAASDARAAEPAPPQVARSVAGVAPSDVAQAVVQPAPSAPAPPRVSVTAGERPQLAVADITGVRPGSLPIPPIAARSAHAPVATRMVSPEYPYAAGANRKERVELRFAINAAGGVDDIAVLSAPANRAFTRAAENALKQWRFDPASVAAGGRARYRQAFVFAPETPKVAESGPTCVRRTGTQLCRRSDESPADAAEPTETTTAAVAHAPTVNATLSAP